MTQKEYEKLQHSFTELDGFGMIKKLYELTDETGRLVIPAWPYDGADSREQEYVLKMTWKEADRETLIRDYAALWLDIAGIAEVNGDLYEDYEEEECERLILPEHLESWRTYLRPLDAGDADPAKIQAIYEKISAEEEIDPAEEACYRAYVDKKRADAESRIGGKYARYEVIVRAERLYRLLAGDAPEMVIRNEERYLVQAMAVNRYAEEMEERNIED